MSICPKCGEENTGNYCSNCGELLSADNKNENDIEPVLQQCEEENTDEHNLENEEDTENQNSKCEETEEAKNPWDLQNILKKLSEMKIYIIGLVMYVISAFSVFNTSISLFSVSSFLLKEMHQKIFIIFSVAASFSFLSLSIKLIRSYDNNGSDAMDDSESLTNITGIIRKAASIIATLLVVWFIASLIFYICGAIAAYGTVDSFINSIW